MSGKKKISFLLAFGFIVLVLGGLAWFLTAIFEGESPVIELEPSVIYISGPQEFSIRVTDHKSGLKFLEVKVAQEGRATKVFEKKFPYKGLLNKSGIHEYEQKFTVDPAVLALGQGRVDLIVQVRDYSRRSGGDGNLALVKKKMIVDTIPPSIRVLSRMNYANVGGSCLVVYEVSSDTVKSGIFVNNTFFPGYPAGDQYVENGYVCYFGIPFNIKGRPQLYLWAEDRAGNQAKIGFYYRIRSKRFRSERINITDRLLQKILPYFASYLANVNGSDVDKFLKINRELRKENGKVFYDLRTKTSPKQLWEGTWLRLKNSATMARFADHRYYYYKGKKIDEQIHMGVDLASLAHSEVQASNSGRVIFADNLGIYGLTVVLDHGQGLASTYSHLSQITVKLDQEVQKGEVIGITGQTGLAAGDHLHFGVMVNGLFVNPMEWWDSHWIRDNITRKLAMLKK